MSEYAIRINGKKFIESYSFDTESDEEISFTPHRSKAAIFIIKTDIICALVKLILEEKNVDKIEILNLDEEEEMTQEDIKEQEKQKEALRIWNNIKTLDNEDFDFITISKKNKDRVILRFRMNNEISNQVEHHSLSAALEALPGYFIG